MIDGEGVLHHRLELVGSIFFGPGPVLLNFFGPETGPGPDKSKILHPDPIGSVSTRRALLMTQVLPPLVSGKNA